MALLGINVPPRSRTFLRYLGYVALGLVSFAFALQLTFPYGRVKDRIVEELSKSYDVVIGGVERGYLPGKMILTNVSLKTRPTQPGQVPTLLYIKQLSLDLGVLALLGKKAQVDVEAQIGNGVLVGQVTLAKDQVQLAFHSDELPGASLPLKELVGLPVLGKISLDLRFDSRLQRNTVDWTKVTAHLQLGCPSGCTVGDGKTKLRPQVKRQNQAEFVKDGIEFNKVNIDKLLARLEIKKGVAKVVKFETSSKDGELYIDFEAKLEKLLNNSQVTGCLRYKPSKELETRDYRTALQLKTTGAPLGPDELFHIKLQGPMREIKRLGVVCGPAAAGAANGTAAGAGGTGGGDVGRPSLPATPEPEPRQPLPNLPVATPPTEPPPLPPSSMTEAPPSPPPGAPPAPPPAAPPPGAEVAQPVPPPPTQPLIPTPQPGVIE